MSKVVKLKQSDIEKIVESILQEQEWKGSTNPEIMQLGQVGSEEVSDEEGDTSSLELSLGQDEQGNFYVMNNTDGEEPKVLAKTK